VLTRLARLKRRVVARRAARLQPVNPDVEDFLRVARLSFVKLQAAWDAADLRALAALTTEQLLAELQDQLSERGPGPNRTEVLSLDARLLGIEELQEAFVASIEFSGLIRERLDDGAAPFRELWLLANMKAADRGWRLARVQALG
jgi:predicted lipid-binding transport protein (Tim44 family)